MKLRACSHDSKYGNNLFVLSVTYFFREMKILTVFFNIVLYGLHNKPISDVRVYSVSQEECARLMLNYTDITQNTYVQS
jgi:hypothetical protein